MLQLIPHPPKRKCSAAGPARLKEYGIIRTRGIDTSLNPWAILYKFDGDVRRH
jgi:hypothetical protein